MVDLPDVVKTEAAIVRQTNSFRRSEKLGELKESERLRTAATLFAQYLAKTGKFAHEADGRKPADRIKAAGYTYCTVGENLALHQDSRGFTSEALAGKSVEGWKSSPPHRANMLTPGYTEIGVGIAKAPDRDPKYISVQLFGRPDALKYQFKIDNRSGATISYRIDGKGSTVASGSVVSYTTCHPSTVAFERAGNFLFGTKLSARFEAQDGAVYTVAKASNGTIRVDATAAKRPR